MKEARTWQVAVLPGDGVGPEVVREAIRVLDTLGAMEDGPSIACTSFDWPSHQWHEQHGEIAPADYLEQLGAFDAILLGALGDCGPRRDPHRTLQHTRGSLAPQPGISKNDGAAV